MAPSPRANDSWRRTHSPRRSIAKLLESPTWQSPTIQMRPDYFCRSNKWPPLRRIVHFHEVLDPESAGTNDAALDSLFAAGTSMRADLVIVPDAERAKMLAAEANLTTAPTVVMNCPPLLDGDPKSRLLPELHKRGVHVSTIVHYQGAIGADHHLEELFDRWCTGQRTRFS